MKRALLVLLVLVACGTATSGATYTASSKNPQGFGAAADFGVTASLADPGSPLRQTVTLTATASNTQGGSITQVVIQRSPAGAGTWTTICTRAASPYTCSFDTTGVADGQYDLRVRATNQNGYTKTSAVVANRQVDNTAPSVTLDNPGDWIGGSVTLTSTASDTAGGSGVANVRYEYRPTAGGSWTTACTGSSAPFSCSFATGALTNGTGYDFRAVATDAAGNAEPSAVVLNRRVDRSAPGGTFTDPGTNLRQSVSLTMTGTDGESGVASVRVQYTTAGGTTWSTACVDTSSPYACSWDTTTAPSGLLDLRAVITDMAGNSFTTAVYAGRRVDNVLPTITLTDPGSPISGTLTLNATASDAGSGMATVVMEYKASASATWSAFCTDNASPYQCQGPTTGLADGFYDLRATANDVAGNANAATLTRLVDNYVPNPTDFQGINGGGPAGLGLLRSGDSITLTYSEALDPATIVAGWNGTDPQPVTVRATHFNSGDVLTFYDAANSVMLPLTTTSGVNLKADYVPTLGVIYAATLTRSGGTYTITFGAATGSQNATAAAGATMQWFPSAGARDYANKPSGTAQRNETGNWDTDF